MSRDPDPRVGLTGARFGRVRRDPVRSPGTPETIEPPETPGAPTERWTPDAPTERGYPASDLAPDDTGPPDTDTPDTETPDTETPDTETPDTDRPDSDTDSPEIDPDAVSAPTVRVRPYVHTGGRTRTHTPLPIEALVCAVPGSSALRLHGTHRSVLELCRVPQSVAEVSARLGVPLAVARVLVDDLVAQQVVTVQRGVEQNAPDIALMRRVLAGLHQL